MVEVVRTTFDIDEDVLRMVKTYAKARSLTLGDAVAELIRRGIHTRRPAAGERATARPVKEAESGSE
jgi:hypothetical protein